MLRAGVLIAVLAFLAYVPALSGDFVYDDVRFITANEAVRDLTPARAISYFTDPKTVDPRAWRGIYRPLRTLEFALDWAVSGGAAWFFHLRSILWHVLASLLVLGLFRRLTGDPPGQASTAAVCGALLYALHPVHTECVAWISSRGDLLCSVLFLFALNSHLDGRRLRAALLLAVAVFAKETAVVFAGAALLADLYRRERPSLRWLALYALIGAAFTGLWFRVAAGGDPAEMGQVAQWWGGSYPMNLATMAKGFLYYAKLLVLPVELVTSYVIPVHSSLDTGTAVSIGLLLLLIAALLWGGRRSRFALLWFALTILPVSNLIIKVLIPTAERFLLLPSIGVLFAGGWLLARTRLRVVVLVCFFALTFSRTFDWRSEKALWQSVLSVAETPAGLNYRAARELGRALETRDPADAEKVLDTVDAYFRYHADHIQLLTDLPPGMLYVDQHGGGQMLLNQARALLLLGRYEEAYHAAMAAAGPGGRPEGLQLAETARRHLR